MNDAFLQIWKFIVRAVPKIAIVNAYEGGVRLRCGKYIKELKPGVYLCLPFVDYILKIPTKPQVEETKCQSITTLDGCPVGVGISINYSVSSPRMALLNVYDLEGSLLELVRGEAAAVISKHTFKECCDIDKIKAEILNHIQARTRGWGVNINNLYLPDLARHTIYRIMSDIKPVVPVPFEDEE